MQSKLSSKIKIIEPSALATAVLCWGSIALVNEPDVRKRLGVKTRKELYAIMRLDGFPCGYKIRTSSGTPSRSMFWFGHELDEWLIAGSFVH